MSYRVQKLAMLEELSRRYSQECQSQLETIKEQMGLVELLFALPCFICSTAGPLLAFLACYSLVHK